MLFPNANHSTPATCIAAGDVTDNTQFDGHVMMSWTASQYDVHTAQTKK